MHIIQTIITPTKLLILQIASVIKLIRTPIIMPILPILTPSIMPQIMHILMIMITPFTHIIT